MRSRQHAITSSLLFSPALFSWEQASWPRAFWRQLSLWLAQLFSSALEQASASPQAAASRPQAPVLPVQRQEPLQPRAQGRRPAQLSVFGRASLALFRRALRGPFFSLLCLAPPAVAVAVAAAAQT